MNKIAHYLQEHLLGEVTSSAEVRGFFSKDASILTIAPGLVVYPRTEEDVRKTASFCWQLAQRGQRIPMTPRGGGSDTSGAAIGPGIMLVFTAHMNKILSLDFKKKLLNVEPGATYDKIEQTLYTHGLFLPPYPTSLNYATIGGGIANNSMGEKSVKYGVTGDYVKSLRVVLSNGEVIETRPLSRRELNHKLGLSTLEGEIYRQVDGLIEENAEIIKQAKASFAGIRNSTGYNIFNVKKKGSFDLTPLIVGSQGSLGIVTEAQVATVPHNPVTTLCLASLPDLNSLAELLPAILKLKPSMLDMINHPAIDLVTALNPSQLRAVIDNPQAAIHLIIEFDDFKEGAQKKSVKNLAKLIERVGGDLKAFKNPNDQELVRKIRGSVSTILSYSRTKEKAVPVAEDVSVPVHNMGKFITQTYETYRELGLRPAAWGHIGDGVIRVQPLLDLSNLGDRQRLFKVADKLYSSAMEHGGSVSGSAGDGRIRAPYLRLMYGDQLHGVMMAIKKVFDPYNILNPGVKTASVDEVKAMMRTDYGLGHYHTHLPRS